MIEITEALSQHSVIKVIGIGDAGGNAINYMIKQCVQGVEFIAIDTDAQTLHRSLAHTRLRIGAEITDGLEVFQQSSASKSAAEEFHERIRTLICNADMVFITAGMEGSTGTDVVPVVAQIAREINIVTVAVVAMPLAHGDERICYADEVIKALHEHVDALIIVPNTTAKEDLCNLTPAPEAFTATNLSIHRAIVGIVGMSDRNGLISIDFSEVCAILSKAGIVMMGVGLASGPGRESIAAQQAMADLMSGNMDMNDARTILINFTSTGSLKLKEVAEVMKYVKVATRNAMMVCGASVDESMDKELCVTVFAIGLCVPLESNPVIQIRTDQAKNNF